MSNTNKNDSDEYVSPPKKTAIEALKVSKEALLTNDFDYAAAMALHALFLNKEEQKDPAFEANALATLFHASSRTHVDERTIETFNCIQDERVKSHLSEDKLFFIEHCYSEFFSNASRNNEAVQSAEVIKSEADQENSEHNHLVLAKT